jgi:hypothetical protein
VCLAVTVVSALLMIGGEVRAQPFNHPELSDVVDAVFYNATNSGFSYVVAQMNGGSGILYPRFRGYHWGFTKNYNSGLIVFDLYEADDIKRKGAGSWQMKQSDFAQFAFWLSTTYGGFSYNSPTYSPVTSLYTYQGYFPVTYPMYRPGNPGLPITGCNGSITTKDKNRDGLPETASWKASCNPKALTWLSKEDQKLFKKVLKGLKGKGSLPAYWSVNY